VYIDLQYYKSNGGIDMTDAAFSRNEFRARKTVDRLTQGRVQNMAQVPEAVKLCMMQAIQYDATYGVEAQADNPVISSYNTDGYSESYGSASDQAQAAHKSLYRTVRNLLYGELDDKGVPLLYRGVNG
jgi:hypothetical protein